MSLARRLDRSVGAKRAHLLLDGCLFCAFATAVWLCHATGLAGAAFLAVVIASLGLEYVVSNAVTDRLLRATDWRADTVPPAIETAVAELSEQMGIDPPRIRVDPGGSPGVNVLRDDAGPVLLLSGSLPPDLDDGAVRGIVAHELAHVSLGHLRRFPLRDATIHVVGFAALWAVVLRDLWIAYAFAITATYLAAAAFRSSSVNALFYAVASFGTVVALRLLVTRTSRLEECRADDLAVEHTSVAEFCTGLSRVGTANGRGPRTYDSMAGSHPRAEQRGFLEGLTAVHPTIDYRLSRLGFSGDERGGDTET